MGLKRGIKKGIYFTIDSVIAGGIILVVIILASSFYLKEQPTIHLNYLAQDLTTVLSTLTVEEIDNAYLDSLVGTEITNTDNTVLEQIVEFWANNKMDLADKSFRNVTGSFVSNTTGFGLWIDNENIYSRGIPIKRSLVSSKKFISGIKKGQIGGLTRKNPPTLLGPAIVEVRVWE